MTSDRVIVFDDPVSSLDCDILFIVRLVKGLVDEVKNGAGNIKQIFVLTHNVYFHREVAYKCSGAGFWIVRKSMDGSELTPYQCNPITSSYEMLWREVRDLKRSDLSIQNTLRRILEYYFMILGSKKFDDIWEQFDGDKKLVCRSLFSWVHAGSHHPLEDLYISHSEGMIDMYLGVFKEIFINEGHIDHYNMMMDVDNSTLEA